MNDIKRVAALRKRNEIVAKVKGLDPVADRDQINRLMSAIIRINRKLNIYG